MGKYLQQIAVLEKSIHCEDHEHLRVKNAGPLAGEWIVSQHIAPNGKQWTYMQKVDAKSEAAWEVGSLDDGQKHRWTVEERLSATSGRKFTVVERDDGKAWEINRPPQEAA